MNHFEHGKKWDGKTFTACSITYNNVTKSIEQWVIDLEMSKATLRRKLKDLESGEIGWDECMADKAERYRLQCLRKKQRRQEVIKAERLHREKYRESIDKINAAIDGFLYER